MLGYTASATATEGAQRQTKTWKEQKQDRRVKRVKCWEACNVCPTTTVPSHAWMTKPCWLIIPNDPTTSTRMPFPLPQVYVLVMEGWGAAQRQGAP